MTTATSREAFDEAAWPLARIGEAMRATAAHAGLEPHVTDVPHVTATRGDAGAWLERAMASFAERFGLEAVPVGSTYGDVPALVSSSAPALVWLPGGNMLCVVAASAGKLHVLAPDLTVARLAVPELVALLRAPLDEAHGPAVDRTLDAAAIPERRRSRARAALLGERLASERVEGVFLLRHAPGRPVVQQLRHAGLTASLGRMILAHAGDYALLVGGFWALGRGALEGQVEAGWLAAWALALVTRLPLRAYAAHGQGVIAVELGVLLKRRILAGIFKLQPEEIRGEGAGLLLGRVLECEAVETLAISGGLASLLAVVDLAAGALILSRGVSPAAVLSLLAMWIVFAVALALLAHARRRAWTDARATLTDSLVERLVGHRTRLVQEHPDRWHDDEDRAVARSFDLVTRVDRAAASMLALVPRGWLVVSLATAALASGARSPVELAITVGGALMVQSALTQVVKGAAALSGARIAWCRAGELVRAASREEPVPSPHVALADAAASESAALEARDLVYRHAGRGEPVLRELRLRIGAGEHVVVEGDSGSGKSTLAAVLAGLREPQAGLVLHGGLDPRSLGRAAWRRRVAAAPQFHENHVLGATFGFNLLMGRRWPPRPSDLEEALEICKELDLGPLIARMPAGLEQMVGETGWQLSHGEKSRLFVARALLQGAEVVVLDESIGALDPRTMQRVVDCIARRSKSSLLIAHR